MRTTLESRGEEYLSWPQRALFDRIGARHFVLEPDPFGNFLITGYDYGSARDWARLGLLYLWEGDWMGERIIPKDFVEFVQEPAPAWNGGVYGGLFWLNRGARRFAGLPDDTYYMAGSGGNRVVIIPSPPPGSGEDGAHDRTGGRGCQGLPRNGRGGPHLRVPTAPSLDRPA